MDSLHSAAFWRRKRRRLLRLASWPRWSLRLLLLRFRDLLLRCVCLLDCRREVQLPALGACSPAMRLAFRPQLPRRVIVHVSACGLHLDLEGGAQVVPRPVMVDPGRPPALARAPAHPRNEEEVEPRLAAAGLRTVKNRPGHEHIVEEEVEEEEAEASGLRAYLPYWRLRLRGRATF